MRVAREREIAGLERFKTPILFRRTAFTGPGRKGGPRLAGNGAPASRRAVLENVAQASYVNPTFIRAGL